MYLNDRLCCIVVWILHAIFFPPSAQHLQDLNTLKDAPEGLTDDESRGGGSI